jgi:peptidoglycan/LPS O-acetylase OafA/YrhL
LAIISVVCFHVNELFISNHGYSTSLLSSLPPFKGGWVGVPLFFVLSGFLIGGQLWKELSLKNSISFWRFILRRGFRIWPLYYFVLLIVYIFSAPNTFDFKGLISNFLFIGNYLSDFGPISGSWSLATEEQFYILAPLFLIIIYKYIPNKKLSFYRKILFVIFFIPLLSRYITWDLLLRMKEYDINTYMKYIYRPFHTNCEGLVAGMIISNYYYDKESNFNKNFENIYIVLSAALIIFVSSFYSKIYLNFTGVTLGFSALLIYFLKVRHNKCVDFFSSNFLYIISKTSFAIYLIHFYVIKYLLSVSLVKVLSLGFGNLEILVAFISVMTVSVFISIFLYIIIEKPFMLLREKLIKNTIS